MGGGGWRSLPGIHTWEFIQGAAMPKLKAGTCWVGNLDMDFGGLGRGDKWFNDTLRVCLEFVNNTVSVSQSVFQWFHKAQVMFFSVLSK